jgi:hypothetical protein
MEWKMILQQRRAVLAIAAPLIFGLVSLTFGRDTNWDLRNYHWYNPYAWLTDRYQIDIAPAGWPSFLTPLLDIPWFVLDNVLPAPAIGFLLGAFQSLNLILLYYLVSTRDRSWRFDSSSISGKIFCCKPGAWGRGAWL